MSFNITEHRWEDFNIEGASGDVGKDLNLCIEYYNHFMGTGGYNTTSVDLTKQDALAIFKHLGDKDMVLEVAKYFGVEVK